MKAVKSVLGKLIQQEFGRESYQLYAEKLERKESMDIFCDIYESPSLGFSTILF